MEKQLEQFYGCVENIKYQNPTNGYSIVDFSTDKQHITAVGSLPTVTAGDYLVICGFFTVHKIYGDQFEIESFEFSAPKGEDAIYKYLSSGAIKGIGPALALRIVKEFGENTLEVLSKEPKRLSQIKGISFDKAIVINQTFLKSQSNRDELLKFSNLNILPFEALHIGRVYGSNCVDIIYDNPYLLCEEPINYSFERVEKIAKILSIGQKSNERLCGGVLYVLKHNLLNGHTCIPYEKICTVSQRLLQTEAEEVERAIEDLLVAQKIAEYYIDEKRFLYLNSVYCSEKYIAKRVVLCRNCDTNLTHDIERELNNIETINNIQYDEKQKNAIKAAFQNNIFILTGGPGTGKTTTLKAIISLIEQLNYNYFLAAPTGRAAKRMTELTGREAATIHRLLGVEYTALGQMKFVKCEKDLIKTDFVIIDESSMMDIYLFEALLKALPMDTRIILVGDANQLPAVGPGNVLRDLIDTEAVPYVELNTIFRQSMDSLIIRNAHNVIGGRYPEVGDKDADFFIVNETDPEKAQNLIVDLYVNRLPEKFGFNPNEDIQVLCPTKLGLLGTEELNAKIREKVNPSKTGKKEITVFRRSFRVDDKVIQCRNNYDLAWRDNFNKEGLGVFNGDIGTVVDAEKSLAMVKVAFDDHFASYNEPDCVDLKYAYAVTVHKSQGSEYDCVILPILGSPMPLRYRNLLYTAVTRAKKLLIIIGSKKELEDYIGNDRKHLRYTGLKYMIKEYLADED